MERVCGSCGVTYEAHGNRAKYCGERCKKRAQRGHLVVPLPVDEPALVLQTRRELTEAERLDTWQGQQALGMATRIAAGQDTGSGLAALNREFSRAMAEALKGAKVATSAVDQRKDELAARRARGA